MAQGKTMKVKILFTWCLFGVSLCSETDREARDIINTNKDLGADRRSLMYQGVYIPDRRFNAFVDGVMINMIEEIKRRRLDPMYFRVNSDGTVKHVSTHKSRTLIERKKTKRDTDSVAPLGGGVVKGTSKIRRFGEGEVQIAGNITLVRSHWLMGPLNIIIDYRGGQSISRVRTTLEAVQMDALTSIDRFGAQKEEFRINGPLFEYMAYYGNRTLSQQKLTELVMKFLFSERSFLSQFLEETFALASFDKIIPQFGAGDNYFSVLQYLLNRKAGRQLSISGKIFVNSRSSDPDSEKA